MAFTFLAALGHAVGRSTGRIPIGSGWRAQCWSEPEAGSSVATTGGRRRATAVDNPMGLRTYPSARFHRLAGLDIGPATVTQFGAALSNAKTVVWNGPMGVFEKEAFRVGNPRRRKGGQRMSALLGRRRRRHHCGDPAGRSGLPHRIRLDGRWPFLEFLEAASFPASPRWTTFSVRYRLMRVPLVIGNWKMHGGLVRRVSWPSRCGTGFKRPRGVEVVVCPPFTALSVVAEALQARPSGWARRTATGRTAGRSPGRSSPPMLAELGCRLVLLGHSERRHVFTRRTTRSTAR
jgi:triosephosphate isomerase